MAVVDETCAADVVVHGITESTGIDDYKRFIGPVYDAFPDKHAILDDMIVEGDKVAIRFTETGTHKGAYMGFSPTYRKVTIRGVEIDRVAGGRFVEIWSAVDTLGFVQQLGSMPTPGKESGGIDPRRQGSGKPGDRTLISLENK